MEGLCLGLAVVGYWGVDYVDVACTACEQSSRSVPVVRASRGLSSATVDRCVPVACDDFAFVLNGVVPLVLCRAQLCAEWCYVGLSLTSSPATIIIIIIHCGVP